MEAIDQFDKFHKQTTNKVAKTKGGSMIVRVLHFGDFHSQNGNFNGKKEAEMVVRALSVLNKVDKYIVVFSGDLAFKGIHEEYKQIKYFWLTEITG